MIFICVCPCVRVRMLCIFTCVYVRACVYVRVFRPCRSTPCLPRHRSKNACGSGPNQHKPTPRMQTRRPPKLHGHHADHLLHSRCHPLVSNEGPLKTYITIIHTRTCSRSNSKSNKSQAQMSRSITSKNTKVSHRGVYYIG